MVKVEYVFSRNKKIGSRIISYFTKSLGLGTSPVPSHVAVLIDNKWIYEATISSGVRVISYKRWLTINEQTHRIDIGDYRHHSQLKTIMRETKAKRYDYLGVIYLGIFILRKLLTRIEVPIKNKWHSPDKYFCSELVGKLLGISHEMSAPVEILIKLQERDWI